MTTNTSTNNEKTDVYFYWADGKLEALWMPSTGWMRRLDIYHRNERTTDAKP
ncbi:MAG: hypothetical protein ACFFCW_01865 [Candidatus Hodarchaeota archaeon]